MLEKPRPWWVLLALVPFGTATWIGMLYAAARSRLVALWVGAVVFFAAAVVTWVWTDGAFIILSWIAGLGACVGLAPAWQRRMRSRTHHAVSGARERLGEREEARRLAREDPTLAREAGVGRPDVPGAAHGGLVDVNGAGVEVLARLPGVDDALADRIARAREELDGFASVADLGAALDLPADTVEDLRDRVVFLPR